MSRRAVMRYYGGKHRISAEIVALMPAHAVYVEPFGGAASVLLAKTRCACEVYNDLNGEVVNVFRVLRDSQEALLRGLALTPYAREEYLRAYEVTSDPIEAARRFVFRSNAGIGSDAGRRKSGFRNSLDDGKYAHAMPWAGLPGALVEVCERLQGVIIECRDAVAVMRQYDGAETLHYVDPPYLASSRKRKTKAYSFEMLADEEHEVLLDVVKGLRGRVIVSGYETKLYEAALTGWWKRCFAARDQTNGARSEVVWMNFEPEARLF